MPNISAETAVRRELQKLIRAMVRQARKRALDGRRASEASGAVYAGDDTPDPDIRTPLQGWSDIFARAAEALAARWAARVFKHNRTQFNSILDEAGGLAIDRYALEPAARMAAETAIADMVSAIRTIPEEFFAGLQKAVKQSAEAGGRAADITAAVMETGAVSERRAEFIARDQTRRFNSVLTATRGRDAGLDEFIWLHSSAGKKPRPMHVALDGKTCRMSDPPVIDADGTRGLPGELFNCRCVMKLIYNPVTTANGDNNGA